MRSPPQGERKCQLQGRRVTPACRRSRALPLAGPTPYTLYIYIARLRSLVNSGTSRIHINRLSSSAPSRLSFARSRALGAAKRRHRRSWETCASTRVEGRGIESDVPVLGTEPCDDRSAGWRRREGGLLESSGNGVASSAGAEVVPSDVRSVTNVGMEERRSRRKRKARGSPMPREVSRKDRQGSAVVGIHRVWAGAGGDTLRERD